MTRTSLVPALLALLLAGAAVAQSTGHDVVIERAAAAPARQDGLVRVQLAIQIFVAGPTDESEEGERQRERARRVIYDLAAKECELLRNSIANDCRLESVNVNLNRQTGPQQVSGYQVMGNMAYQITLK